MPFDFKLANYCDHKIWDERLEIDGSTPNYFAILKFETNGDAGKIQIRDYSNSEGVTNFSYFKSGITDFILSGDDKTLIFNNYISDPMINYLEGSTNIYPQPIYLASYITKQNECPKCLGLNKVSDIDIDAVGSIKEVEGKELIKQKIVKALLTLKGNNEFNQSYGSSISDAIGRPSMAFTMLSIQQSIFDCINNLIDIQSEKIDFLPDDEIILGIENLNIEPVGDSRNLLINLVVKIGTFENISIKFEI